MTIYYLYVKTHNKTGLKYLGKTTQKDPHKYRGSGNYWTAHIKKHGYDVTTEILCECSSNEELKKVGLYYSELWNVVKSPEWANLKPESGNGGFEHLNDGSSYHIERTKRGYKKSLAKVDLSAQGKMTMERCRKEKRGVFSPNYLGPFTLNKDLQGLGNSPASRAKAILTQKETFKKINHQQGERNSQFGTMWITNEIESVKIKNNAVIPDGWRKGRKIK